MLGVSRDSIASHRKFIDKHALPFVLLSDTDGSVMRAYSAWGEKMMYGRKVEGVIRSSVAVGPDGTVLKHWPKIAKADTHAADVLAFLQTR